MKLYFKFLLFGCLFSGLMIFALNQNGKHEQPETVGKQKDENKKVDGISQQSKGVRLDQYYWFCSPCDGMLTWRKYSSIVDTYKFPIVREASIDGRMQNLFCLQDFVCFVDRYYANDSSLSYYTKKTNKTLDELMQEQDYIQAFLIIKKITKKADRIALFEKYANQGHMFCMFEMAYELGCEYKKINKADFLVIQEWVLRGYMRLLQDIRCHNDKSVTAAFGFLNDLYIKLIASNKKIIEVQELGILKDPAVLVEICNKCYVWVSNLLLLPSPVWVGYHGLAPFKNGLLDLKPQNEWDEIRKKALDDYCKPVLKEAVVQQKAAVVEEKKEENNTKK